MASFRGKAVPVKLRRRVLGLAGVELEPLYQGPVLEPIEPVDPIEPLATRQPIEPGRQVYPVAGVCLAPSVMMYLDPEGNVRPCCKNHVSLGNIGTTRLRDIWAGVNRRLLEDAVARLDFSFGCVQCAAEVDAEGRELVYPSNFDVYGPQMAPEPEERWPLRLEFNISNSCNLQCIQCNGLLSSSIRLHRERRPPLPKLYGEEFFEDLELFIPHLVDAQFAGGEPFMAEENYRIWDMIARLNPDLRCETITNATQWNKRVERVVNELRMGFVFSLDAVTKELYESVRIGADFESVMANVERYSARARANELPLEVNYCLMVQNYQGFADVLLWAEEREIHVNVSVVRDPPHCSLAAADDGFLRNVLDLYASQDDRMLANLTLNRRTWQTELVRLQRWLDAGETGRTDLWGEPNYMIERRHTRAVRALQAFGDAVDDRTIHEAVADESARIVRISDSFGELVGVDPADAVAEDLRGFMMSKLADRFGEVADLVMLLQTPECTETELTAGDTLFRVVSFPTPGLDGRVRTTTVQFAEIDASLRGVPFVNASDWPTT